MTRRTALVTGGNRGIGLAVCKGLAQRCIDVIVTSRDVEAGREAISEIGDRVSVEYFNARDHDSVDELVSRLDQRGVCVDVLVNNAAIYPAADALLVDDATISDAWEVNVMAPWRLIRRLTPGMVSRGYGRIVNISSGSGSLSTGGDPAHASYAVTKSALNALTVNLARTIPSTVKANAMCPGWVRTRMGGEGAPRTPDEGADTAIWLATLPDDGPTGGFFRDRRPIDW